MLTRRDYVHTCACRPPRPSKKIPHKKVEFQLKGDDSKVGRRISKIRNRKARSQRKARLKHQGGAAATTAAVPEAAAAEAEAEAEARGGTEQQATQARGEERAREAHNRSDDTEERRGRGVHGGVWQGDEGREPRR